MKMSQRMPDTRMKPEDIKKFLPLVRRPSRYIGGEVNSVKKDLSRVSLVFGLAFPDAYEVGMSHLGLQILYQRLNSRDDIACERVFAPWLDMEALLREKGAPLSTLESNVPLSDLHILGFSLQYELSYTNVLGMMALGNVTLLSDERAEGEPLVIGGGPSAFNPEPVADFFDAFLLGDGESAAIEICDAVIEGRKNGEARKELLKRLSRIDGVYVPSFYEARYHTDGTIWTITPLEGVPPVVLKRTEPDISALPVPARPVVPFMETVHDRVTVEIARGCTRGCRFCEAGMIYRPAREKDPEKVVDTITEALRNTGYDEVSLLSLSTGDYTPVEDLLTGLMQRFEKEHVAVSLPSLRVGTLSSRLASEIRKVRKTGFTLAPEAGTERMRRLINKGITEADLLACARDIFSLGWKAVKLYFMIGLPGETDEDVLGIAELAARVRAEGRRAAQGRAPEVNVSVSVFIPKPHTPFQWAPQISKEEASRKLNLLKKRLTELRLGFRWHDPEIATLEGVFSRGDRRLSGALLAAFEAGCRFDGWGDVFRPDLWAEALRACGVDVRFYNERERGAEETLAWDHLSSGVTKRFLLGERSRASAIEETPDCKVDRCSNCGVCDHKVIKNMVVPAAAKAGPEADDGPKAEPYKLRLAYSKTGDMRFLGHLELVAAITRAVRRAGLPVRYSQGFHPMPRMSFSQPLPVGLESLSEVMDMELDAGDISASEAAERLNATAPEGLEFSAVGSVPLKLPLPSAMMAEYIIMIREAPCGLNIDFSGIDGFLRDFLSRDAVQVTSVKDGREKIIDIRPAVHELTPAPGHALRLVLKKTDGPSVRPHDVAAALFGLSPEDASLIPIQKIRAL